MQLAPNHYPITLAAPGWHGMLAWLSQHGAVETHIWLVQLDQ
jgi:DNA primase